MINLAYKTPYCFQGDSSNWKQAWRMCFSASCAMLAESINPGCLRYNPLRRGRQLDDFYRETLESLHVGDTTEPAAQLATLRHFCPGWDFEYRQDCNFDTIRKQLELRIPVPIGILHHGPLSAPTGGGHWICPIGWEGGKTPDRLIIHDPAGELDVKGGGYMDSSPTAGKEVRYSADGLGRRWMCDINGNYTPGRNGWAILAHKKAA